MAEIKVSTEIYNAFEHLKKVLKTLYPDKEIKDDDIMGAMIGGFFDSLQYMQEKKHHSNHKCCSKGKCKNDGECKCY